MTLHATVDEAEDYLDSADELEKYSPPPETADPETVTLPRTVFYYIRDERHRPVITICLVHLDQEWSRGVAICSPRDMPCCKRGRAIALGRAKRAWMNRQTEDDINRDDIRQYIFRLASLKDGPTLPSFKSEYMPLLTYFERRLLYGLAVAQEV